MDAVVCRSGICKLGVGHNTHKLALLSCKLRHGLELIALRIHCSEQLCGLVTGGKSSSTCSTVGDITCQNLCITLTCRCYGCADIRKLGHDEISAILLGSLDVGDSHAVAYDYYDVLGILEVVRSGKCSCKGCLKIGSDVGDLCLHVACQN